MLLTRSPLIGGVNPASPFDLHVLSTPPAFVLSQDQTLHKKVVMLGITLGTGQPLGGCRGLLGLLFVGTLLSSQTSGVGSATFPVGVGEAVEGFSGWLYPVGFRRGSGNRPSRSGWSWNAQLRVRFVLLIGCRDFRVLSPQFPGVVHSL